jgi:hypothetical protein
VDNIDGEKVESFPCLLGDLFQLFLRNILIRLDLHFQDTIISDNPIKYDQGTRPNPFRVLNQFSDIDIVMLYRDHDAP